MADTIRIRRRAAGGAAGAPASLAANELAYSEVEDILWYGKGNSGGIAMSVLAIGGPGAFAPTNSPALVGTPTAPTVTPSTDNSTKIATTAFVRAALGAAGVTVSDTAPATPSQGQLWWKSDTGALLLNYQDADTTQWVDVAGGGGSSGNAFSTGDAKLTLKIVADAGWVMMNDGTIGDATSGASTRAHADCQALFTLIWTIAADAWAPVTPGGRGANAAADWAAHKKIALTRQLGRTIGIAGAGAGLTNRPLGSFLGEETHTQTLAELAAHTHGYTDPTHTHSWSTSYAWYIYYSVLTMSAQSADFEVPWYNGYYGSGVNSYNGVGITITGQGSSSPMNVMQPTSFWNIMIKL